MTTTIRARGPRELLAYVPFRLGYRPRDSLVLVSLRGPRGQVGLVARVDVDDLADLERGPQVARSMLGHLATDGADRVVLVLYSDAPVRRAGGRAGTTAARARAAVEHTREVAEPVYGPVEAWVVSSSGYAGIDCRDDACCPPGGRPSRDLESSEVSAHMVLAGASVADSRAEALRIDPAPAVARRRAARAADRARNRLERALARPAEVRHDAVVAWRRECLAAWQAAVRVTADPEPGGPDGRVPEATLGRVEAGLACIPVRDAVLLSLLPGTEALADATLRDAEVGAATGEAMAALVDPARGVEPDDDLTGPARRVLEAVVAHGAWTRQAPALTLLALVAWWEGDGGRARERLRDALDADPAHRLALLLSGAVDAGVPPGWVRAGG